jgi:hypothetical protein
MVEEILTYRLRRFGGTLFADRLLRESLYFLCLAGLFYFLLCPSGYALDLLLGVLCGVRGDTQIPQF